MRRRLQTLTQDSKKFVLMLKEKNSVATCDIVDGVRVSNYLGKKPRQGRRASFLASKHADTLRWLEASYLKYPLAIEINSDVYQNSGRHTTTPTTKLLNPQYQSPSRVGRHY